MNDNIKNILVKYLMNAANIEDLEVLTNWLKDDQNKQIFKDFIKVNYAMDINMSKFDTENAKKEYLRKIRQDKKLVHKLKIYKVLKYASAAVIIFGLGYFFKQNSVNIPIKKTPVIVNTPIEPGTDKATLTLGDGSLVVLEKGSTFQTQNVSSNGEKLVYEASKHKPEEIAYNYLTIPRGGQYYVKLSDGTEVWLNSETQLKYPTYFIEGEERKVELVYGEAYFDVSPSTEHNGAKFKVINKIQNVEVFGTEFNISAYKDETDIYTTLIEGKVVVTNDDLNQDLIPNQQLSLDIETNKSSVAVVDVESVVSWKSGIFSFKGKPLKHIMKVLSRWYDIDVVFLDKNLESLKFKGVLSKNQSIEEILSIMKSGSINDYKIMDKTIIIK